MERLRSRLTYSNVVATLALFLALTGGVAWALKLRNNSVKSRHIKNSAVKTQDIGAGQVGAQDIGTAQVGATAIGANAVGASELLDGSVGTNELGTVPAALVARSSGQSLPAGTTVLTFNDESAADTFDTANLHDTTTNNSRLTAPIPGIYYIHGNIAWPNDPDDDDSLFGLTIRLNGNVSTAAGSNNHDNFDDVPSGSTAVRFQVNGLARLDAGEYAELFANQSNADNDSITINQLLTRFGMVWLGPAP